MLKKVSIEHLKVDMYVHEIAEHKGTVSIKTKGRVTSQAIIDALKKKGVKSVIVDTEKAFSEKDNTQSALDVAIDGVKKVKVTSLVDELTRATELHKEGKQIQADLLDSVAKQTSLDIDIPKVFTQKLVASIHRNPNALLCRTKMQEKDDYLLEHSLNVAIILANFAKYLGLSEQKIDELAHAAFLHDIGKIKVEDAILHKPGRLTPEEMEEMKRHVEYGVDYLRGENIPENLITIVGEHHERLDGLGYPQGKKGDEISTEGRMLAIADMYDALTAERVYKPGLSSQKTFSILLADAPSRLDVTLVQHFIQCMGVYPVGSLVLLSNERIAMVMDQTVSPLKPKVKVFYSVRNSHFLPPKDIDLNSDNSLTVTKAVLASDYNIDVKGFFERSIAV